MSRVQSENTVTAIVTCHNYGCFLRQCLDSLLAQTKPFDRIILINDSSSDDTENIWRESYQDRVEYKFVSVRCQKKARDAAMEMIASGLVVCVDADDWLALDYNQVMSAKFAENDLIGLVYCEQKNIRQGDHGWYPYYVVDRTKRDKYQVFRTNIFVNASMFRREAWPQDNRDYGTLMQSGEKFSEDWDVWLDIIGQGWMVGYVDRQLLYYRVHDRNVTRNAMDNSDDHISYMSNTRERHLPYDLTIIVLRPAADLPLDELQRRLVEFSKPQRTQIIMIESNPAPVFNHPLRAYCTAYFNVPMVIESVDIWKKRALKRVRDLALGRKVLILDDRYSFPQDLYQRLNHSMKQHHADFVSARTRDFYTRGILAWRRRADGGLKEVYVGRGVRRVAATDPINVLMKHRIFRKIELKGESIRKNWSDWAADNQLKWIVDGGVRSSDKDCFRDQYYGKLGRRDGVPDQSLPFVSIIIPVKDSERTLKRLLESLKTLDYPAARYEVIVVNNNSTDKTVEVASSYEFVTLIHEGKPSSYAARNAGIRKSRYPFLAFLDADCEVTKNWLQELVGPAVLDERVGVVAGANQAAQKNNFVSKLERAIGGYMNTHKRENWLYGYAITMNVLYRRRVFDDVGCFDDDVVSGSDVDMSWRAQWQGHWRLVVLGDRAFVHHHDAVNLRSFLKRHYRIGQGHFDLYYKKYPALTLFHYDWMPLTRWEILIKFFRRLIGIELYRIRHKGFFRTRVQVFFNELRETAQRLGFLKRLKEQEAAMPQRSETCILDFSGKGADLNSDFYHSLHSFSMENKNVICFSVCSSVAASWYALCLTLIGGTSVWKASYRIRLMQLWTLFPHKILKKDMGRINSYINSWRINQLLKKIKSERIQVFRSHYLCRMDVFEKFSHLKKSMPLAKRVLPLAANGNYPVMLCALELIDSRLDLNAYSRLAEISFWPIVFTGRIAPSFEKDFFDFIGSNPCFFYMSSYDIKGKMGSYESCAGAAVYLFKSDGRGTGLPDEMIKLQQKGLPSFVYGAKSDFYRQSEPYDSLKKLMLDLNFYQNYPSWNLSMAKSTLSKNQGESNRQLRMLT